MKSEYNPISTTESSIIQEAWGTSPKRKSPARQGVPGQGFAGSVATLPMFAVRNNRIAIH
ncbi:MAG: hypothetical protein SOX46_01010 [Clostridiaceae bacterium]|uniref:Uncharacterized protein n=1 Tax=Clostridium porci TaxID=2605778 RepID=A0A7X2NJY1_9CLOT|nr:hypothetical protein [Clostridium porci]MDY3230154.1 hypothetical protein [Clostridiaceae bacterium]MSS36168.1 hypothetical protein [Clostridium porci]